MGRPSFAALVWLLCACLVPHLVGSDPVEDHLAEALRTLGNADLQALLPLQASERDTKYSADVLEILHELDAENQEAQRLAKAAEPAAPSPDASAVRVADAAAKGARAEAAYLEALTAELRQRLGDARTVAVENMYLKARLEAALNKLAKTQTALDLCGDAQAEIIRLQDAARDQETQLEEQVLLLARAKVEHASEQRRQQAQCHESLLTQASMYGQLEHTLKDMIHHDHLMAQLKFRSTERHEHQRLPAETPPRPSQREVVVHEKETQCASDTWGFVRFTRRAEALRQYYERELNQRDDTIQRLRRDCRRGAAYMADSAFAAAARDQDSRREAAEGQRHVDLFQSKHAEIRSLRSQHEEQLQLKEQQLYEQQQQQEQALWERDQDAKRWQSHQSSTALEKEAEVHRDCNQKLFSRDHTITSLERTIQAKDDQLRAMRDGEGMCQQLQAEADQRLDRCLAQVSGRDDRIFGLEQELQQKEAQREAQANEAKRLQSESHVAQHQIRELQWALAREQDEMNSVQTKLLEFETVQQQGMIFQRHVAAEKQQSRQLMDRVLELDAYVRRLEIERDDWQSRRGDDGMATVSQCHTMLEEVTHWRRQCEADLVQARRDSAAGLWQALPAAQAHRPDDTEALRQELLMTRKRLADAQTLCGEPRKVLQVRERDYGKAREVQEARGQAQDMESRYRRLLEEQQYRSPAACNCSGSSPSAMSFLERSEEVQACHREHLHAQDVYEEWRVYQTYRQMSLQDELDTAKRQVAGAALERTRLLGDIERLRSWETSGLARMEEHLRSCQAQLVEYGGTYEATPSPSTAAPSGWWPFSRSQAEEPLAAEAKSPTEAAVPCKRGWFGWGPCKEEPLPTAEGEPQSTEGCTRGWFGRMHCPAKDVASAGCVVIPPGRNWFGWVPLVRALTRRGPSCQPPCVEDSSGRGWFSFLRRRPPFRCVMPPPEEADATPATASTAPSASPSPAAGPGLMSHITTVMKGVVYVLVLFYVCKLIVQSRSSSTVVSDAPSGHPVSLPGSSTQAPSAGRRTESGRRG